MMRRSGVPLNNVTHLRDDRGGPDGVRGIRQEEAGNGANSASSLSTEKLPRRPGGADFGAQKEAT
jgi:hypothetical protein